MFASPGEDGTERMEQGVLIIVMGTSGSGKSTLGSSLASSLSVPFIDGDDLHPPANVEKMSRGEALDDKDREPWLKLIREKAWQLNQGEARGSIESNASAGNSKAQKELAEVFETSHLDGEKEGSKKPDLVQVNHEEIARELKEKTSSNHVRHFSSPNSEPNSNSFKSTSNASSTGFHSGSTIRRKGCVIACSALKKSYRSLLRGEIDSLSSSSSSSNTSSPPDTPSANSKLNLRVIHLYLRLPPSLLVHRMHQRKNHFMKEGMLKSQLATLQEPNPEGEKDVLVLEAVEGGEWREDGLGNGKEKSKQQVNQEAVEKCRRLLGW